MSYHKDDGTFWSGLFTAFLVILAFTCGYRLRDLNYTINLNQPTAPTEAQTK
jgi:hypothetical protein